ncbi:unnamed protein product [Linum trigynum]|uniref:Prolamin-like domain-containing protein n=1 Tax=Linum trigynum TaxID=586398 RepID=A0AAV2G1N6_9ROSI
MGKQLITGNGTFTTTTTTTTSILLVAILLSSSLATKSTEAAAAADTTNATAAATSTTTMMLRPPGTVCRRGTMPTKLAWQCWVAIFEVPLCIFEIADVFEGGSIFTVGKVCCHAFIDLTDDCKIEVFQHAKFFPVVEKFCSILVADAAAAAVNTTAAAGDRALLPPGSA